MDLEDAYEDEPMTSVRAQEFSGNQMVIENMDEVDRKRRKRRKKRRKRLERLGKIAVCICCIGVIVAIVLTIALTEAAIYVATPAPPTEAPSAMPVIPTYKPTAVGHPTPTIPVPTTPAPVSLEPAPPPTPAPTLALQDEYVINPDQDTYIFLDGKDQTKSFGKEETVLVQKGFQTNDAIADAVILMTFDMTSLPSFENITAETKKATLKLFHKPLDITEQNREPAPIRVSRLPNTELSVETLNGGSYEPKDLSMGATVEVPTEAVEVDFDITELVFNTQFEENQVFLLLETVNQEQEIGDQFFSRESDTPPQLILEGLMP